MARSMGAGDRMALAHGLGGGLMGGILFFLARRGEGRLCVWG